MSISCKRVITSCNNAVLYEINNTFIKSKQSGKKLKLLINAVTYICKKTPLISYV